MNHIKNETKKKLLELLRKGELPQDYLKSLQNLEKNISLLLSKLNKIPESVEEVGKNKNKDSQVIEVIEVICYSKSLTLKKRDSKEHKTIFLNFSIFDLNESFKQWVKFLSKTVDISDRNNRKKLEEARKEAKEEIDKELCSIQNLKLMVLESTKYLYFGSPSRLKEHLVISLDYKIVSGLGFFNEVVQGVLGCLELEIILFNFAKDNGKIKLPDQGSSLCIASPLGIYHNTFGRFYCGILNSRNLPKTRLGASDEPIADWVFAEIDFEAIKQDPFFGKSNKHFEECFEVFEENWREWVLEYIKVKLRSSL